METKSDNRLAWGRYLVASLPGWLICFALTWMLVRWWNLPIWVGSLVLLAWVAADLAAFPRMRHFYESESAVRRMIGESGVAVSDIAPHGFARVHGELWEARASSDWIAQGSAVTVCDVHGLLIFVERAAAPIDAPTRM
jgi:membrane-bound ClpP family serine protease